MRKALLILTISLVGCEVYTERTITCKLPTGEVKSYQSRTSYPFVKGGWQFWTTDGVKVQTTYCHVERD